MTVRNNSLGRLLFYRRLTHRVIVYRTLTTKATGLSFLFIPLFFTKWVKKIENKRQELDFRPKSGDVLMLHMPVMYGMAAFVCLVLLFCETSGERIRSHMHRA